MGHPGKDVQKAFSIVIGAQGRKLPVGKDLRAKSEAEAMRMDESSQEKCISEKMGMEP